MPLPTYSSDLPEHATGRSMVFYLVLLPMGFSLPRPLPCVRCALTTPFHPYPQGAVCFLCHFPSSCDAYPLDSIVPCEARTFLPIHKNTATACLSDKVEKRFYHIFIIHRLFLLRLFSFFNNSIVFLLCLRLSKIFGRLSLKNCVRR